ncbi:MAG: glutathione S-transferase family protein [Granulosicoccus sp.]
MIELYTWNTPNGRKVSIALEEMGLEYRSVSVNIGKDEQFDKDFLAISPNNKIPAIRDVHHSIFESGSILIYLARKSGQFLAPEGSDDYWRTLEWLMWQMGGYGPMLGQAHHFVHFNPEKSEYASERYAGEAQRLTGVLDRRLEQSEFLTENLSIADFAIWPWTSRFEYQNIDLNDFPNVKRWYLQLALRPAFVRGYKVPDDLGEIPLP